ncbi:MAG TPA: 2,3-bisphosphoglycerate-independent phosphoglycerate mutase [Thermoanaerobaculia bacterium]|nr:2,3-bisphosphoglycerate-independent phosphoglycerate mutase [Thermoanaerobaculia bacterium]
MPERPLLTLIVLDGFGCRTETEHNAIAQAETPRFDALYREHAWTTLDASGLAVGLPDGQMGNSEVGHLNIGAGRVVDQDIVRISKSIAHGELEQNPVFVDAVKNARAVHFAGLLSDGGVHSLQEHLHGMIAAARRLGAEHVYVHAILDGRDTPPKSAEKYLSDLLQQDAQVATIVGRYFTMDRDHRWERIQRGYDLMTLGVGTETKDPLETIRRFYEQGVTDEFMEPISVVTPEGAHLGRIEDGDALIFFNFRADRMRQIVITMKDEHFTPFERALHPKVKLVTMNRYHEKFDLPVLYPPEEIRNNLGEVLSKAGLKQFRIAETEKYAHVTFFFNGGSDTQFPGEERLLVPSPKVSTYDKKPSMSVYEVTDKVVAAIASKQYDVVIMNIANPDMVGHTGFMGATVEAVHDTDVCVGRILDAVAAVDGVALITADHGNAELMFDPATGQPHTAHTTNPVPLILVDAKKRFGALRGGGVLSNVAPTILAILGIDKPAEMTAESLLVPDPATVTT